MNDITIGYDNREPLDLLVRQWNQNRRDEHLINPLVTYPLSVDFYVWAPLVAHSSKLPCGLYTEYNRSLEDLGVPIAITVWDSRGKDYFAAICEGLLSESRLDNWTFLGYDIADQYFVSALSNCGVGEEDELTKQKWVKCVNDWGLISEESEASEFRDWSDQRVREHAPFFVYGLYVVDGYL